MAAGSGVRPLGRYALIAELNREWACLIARHQNVPWCAELAGFADLGELISAIRDRPDPLLGALLRESANGDTLAARTVLQAMLGKAVLVANSCPDADPGEVVGALWCRIRTYPLDRRPTRIAANLALDTRKDVVRQLRTDRFADRLLGPTRPMAATRSEPDSCDLAPAEASRLIAVGEQRGIIDAVTAAALRAVYLGGENSRRAAARLGTSPGMIRYRCSRGIRALARHAAELSPRELEDVA